MTINVVINQSTLPTHVTTGSQNSGSGTGEDAPQPPRYLGITRPLLTWPGGKSA